MFLLYLDTKVHCSFGREVCGKLSWKCFKEIVNQDVILHLVIVTLNIFKCSKLLL